MLPKELATLDLEAKRPHFGSVAASLALPRIEVRSTPFRPVRSGLGVLSKQVDPTCGPRYWLQAAGATVLATASGPGRYAVEATAGPLDSATVLDQVQQVRVREFRESRQLGSDSDFAFCFNTNEEAKLAGGDFSRSRLGSCESLGRREASSSSASFSVRGPSSKADVPMSRRSTIRLRPADDQPEQIMNRVAGLTQVFMDAGMIKPLGQISEGMFSERKT